MGAWSGDSVGDGGGGAADFDGEYGNAVLGEVEDVASDLNPCDADAIGVDDGYGH